MVLPNSTMTAPPGTEIFTEEYINESRAHWILIPVSLFSALVPLLVGLRFWARRMGTGNGLGADDWTCLAAMIFALTTNALFISMTHFGFGRHVKTISPDLLSQGLFLWWFAQITYKISLQLTKISLLQLYLRIFSHLIPWFKRTAYILIVILALYTIATCSVSFGQCIPISDAWAVVRSPPPPTTTQILSGGDGSRAPMRPSKNCINLKAFFIFNGTFALLTDLIVLLVPLPMIYTLNPARHQKIALVPLFALGTFIVVISTQRLVFLVTSKPGRDDLTYDLLSTLWTILEYNLGIVCSCAPIVRVFVLKFLVGGVDAGGNSTSRGDGGIRVVSSRLSGRSGRSGLSGRSRGRSGSSGGFRRGGDGKDLDLDLDDEFDLVDANTNTNGDVNSSEVGRGVGGSGKYRAYYGEREIGGGGGGGGGGGRKGSYGSYSTTMYSTTGTGERGHGRGHDRSGSSASGYGYGYGRRSGNGNGYTQAARNADQRNDLTSTRSKNGERENRRDSDGLQVGRRVGRGVARSKSRTKDSTTTTTRGRERATSDSSSDSEVSLILQTPEPLVSPMPTSASRGGRLDDDRSSGADTGLMGMTRLQKTVSPGYPFMYDVDGDYRAQGLR